MLAGVGPVPAVLFVVAADGGWMPQSTEHLDALDALGVRHGVLAVTRSDLADPGPALAAARERLARTSLGGACRRSRSARRPGPASTSCGRRWAGCSRRCRCRRPDEPVRLWVDRAFTIRGSGTVVTGTLGAGTLRVGDELSLDGDAGRGARPAVAGSGRSPRSPATARVAVNLRGVPVSAVRRGAALVTPGAWTSRGACWTWRSPTADLPAELTLHAGSAAVPARVRPLGDDGGPADAWAGRCRCTSATGCCCATRAGARSPPAYGCSTSTRRRCAGAGPRPTGPRCWPGWTRRPDGPAELARRGAIQASRLRAMGVPAPPTAVRAGDWLVDPDQAARWRAALVRAVARARGRAPARARAAGGGRAAAARPARCPDHPRLLALRRRRRRALAAPRRRAAAELVLRDGRVVGAAGVGLPAEIRAAVEAVRADLARHAVRGPGGDRLAELGLGRRELAAAVRAGALLRVADGIYLLPGADAAAAGVLAGLPQPFTLVGGPPGARHHPPGRRPAARAARRAGPHPPRAGRPPHGRRPETTERDTRRRVSRSGFAARLAYRRPNGCCGLNTSRVQRSNRPRSWRSLVISRLLSRVVRYVQREAI